MVWLQYVAALYFFARRTFTVTLTGLTAGLEERMKYIPLGTTGIPLLSYRDNPEIITEDTEWFGEAVESGYGVGVYLDGSGVVVVDCDSSIVHGPTITEHFGWESFLDTCRQLELDGIPRTFTVQTKTPGHFHFYFRQNQEYPLTTTSIHSQIQDVDIKVTGYVKHWACAGYKIVRDVKAIELPTPLAKHLYRAPRQRNADGEVYADGDREMTSEFVDYAIDKLARTVNGSRNAQLFRTAAMLKTAGLTSPLIKSRLSSAALRSGLSLHEATRTIDSAWGKR
jgi:hypothetical protein